MQIGHMEDVAIARGYGQITDKSLRVVLLANEIRKRKRDETCSGETAAHVQRLDRMQTKRPCQAQKNQLRVKIEDPNEFEFVNFAPDSASPGTVTEVGSTSATAPEPRCDCSPSYDVHSSPEKEEVPQFDLSQKPSNLFELNPHLTFQKQQLYRLYFSTQSIKVLVEMISDWLLRHDPRTFYSFAPQQRERWVNGSPLVSIQTFF